MKKIFYVLLFIFIGFSLLACFEEPKYKVTLIHQGGSSETNYVYVKLNEEMPKADIPHYYNHHFLGYFDQIYNGRQYYDKNMESLRVWDKEKNSVLYARWIEIITPVIRLEGSYITWESVVNADKYEILLNNEIVATTTELSYKINNSKTYKIKIRAVNDIYNIATDWSNEIKHLVLPPI